MNNNNFIFNTFIDICQICYNFEHDFPSKTTTCEKCKYYHSLLTFDDLLFFLELFIFNKKHSKNESIF
jgi:hypothetical protein